MLPRMFGATFKVIFLTACFAVAFTALLAATTVPASAHSDGLHATAQSAQPNDARGDLQTTDACCHQKGTCVVQFLPVCPAMKPLDTAPIALSLRFAALGSASTVTTTDPPPPRL